MADKIVHFKKDCIGCGACAGVNPKFWEMNEQGLAQLKGATEVGDHWELKITEEDKECNQEAADVCPVNIIHIKKEEE